MGILLTETDLILEPLTPLGCDIVRTQPLQRVILPGFVHDFVNDSRSAFTQDGLGSERIEGRFKDYLLHSSFKTPKC